jgi:PAS domain S-box-containing protein
LSRLTLALGLTLLAVEAAAALWIVTAGRNDRFSAAEIALALSVGLAFVLSGLVALARRPENRTGVFMLATGYVWFLAALGDSENAWIYSIGYTFGNLVWVPFTALVLAYPSGQLVTRTERAIPVVTGVLLTSTALLTLLFDPLPGPGDCDGCPGSPIVVSERPGLGELFDSIGSLGGLVLVAIVLTILVRRWRSATPALRRLLWPVLLAGGATLVSIGLVVIADQVSGEASDRLQVLFFLALVSVPVAFLLGVLRTRLARASMTDVVVALQEGAPLREALAEALDDPTLELAFRLAGRDQWVDEEGRWVEEPTPSQRRSVTTIERTGLPVAALIYDRSLDESRELVDGVAAAAGLALLNERLQVELRAQFEFLVAMTDTAPSLLVNIDTTGRIRNQNRAAVAAAGVDDQEDVRGHFFWDVFIDPEERDDVIARFEALAPTYEAGEYENTFTNARGERRVIAWQAAPVVLPDGRVETIVAGGLDITDRHRLEEEKELERRFLSAIANEAPSLLCIVDENGRVASGASNKAFERSLGYEPGATGDHVFWERFVAPEEADEVRDAILAVIGGAQDHEHDNHWLTSDGRRLLIAWSCTALPRVDERILFLISGTDITERHRLEANVRAERDFLITLSRATPSLLAVIEADGRVNEELGVSRAFWDVMGYADELAIGRPFWELVGPTGEQDELRHAILDAIASGSVAEHESTWVTRNGRRLAVAWSCRPLGDARGAHSYLVCGTDVTERKQRELQLQRERDATTTVLQTISSVVVVLDKKLAVRDRDADDPVAAVNQAFRDTLWWSDGELVGRDFLELVTDEEGRAREALTGAAGGTVSALVESEWLRADGETVTFQWSAAPVADVTGRTDGLVLVSGVDVTGRKQQELELRASEDRLLAVIRAAPVAIVEVDTEERVTQWNPAAQRMFGWTADEVLGQPLPIVPPGREDEFQDILRQIRGGIAYAGYETERLRRDGSLVDVEISAAPIKNVRGAVVGYLAVINDISDRKRHEHEVRASRARIVAAGDAARRILERNLHDGAQQRLVALSVSLRLAESKLLTDPETAISILASAREELKHALEELRELARGIHPAVLTDRGLNAAVDALVGRSPVPVEAQLPEERLDPAVEAAAYYVISESLANVAKYASADSVQVRVEADDGVVEVVVADDGIGGADPAAGSGLRGLADRVAALDGTLTVESPPGGGTLVRAEIPVRATAQAT